MINFKLSRAFAPSTGKTTMQFKFLSTLLTILFAYYADGQTNYFACNSLTKAKEFSFPVFSLAADSFTTRNINQFLQLSELELLDGHQKNNIFEKVNVDNGGIYGGKVGISYTILVNSPKILSLRFYESSCGMTCTYWTKYYNFNSGNGDPVQLKDLFTTEGIAAFNKIILRKRSANFKKELMKLKSDQRDGLLYILDCYREDDLHDYYIKDTSISIDGENCLSKNDKFFDIDMITKFNLHEFKYYLNDYGKTVFGIKNYPVSGYRSHALPQLFEGTIDSSLKILLIIDHDDKNKIRGGYAYLKFGKLIYLEGELNGQELTLTEKKENSEDNGYIHARFDGNEINGYWTNKSKTKSLKLAAARRIATNL